VRWQCAECGFVSFVVLVAAGVGSHDDAAQVDKSVCTEYTNQNDPRVIALNTLLDEVATKLSNGMHIKQLHEIMQNFCGCQRDVFGRIKDFGLICPHPSVANARVHR
jgi:hypothetical protein